MARQTTLIVPYLEQVVDSSGFLSRVWQNLFRYLQNTIDPLGVEKTFVIENNKNSATFIDGLVFDSKKVSLAVIDYVIQRITSSHEHVESGYLKITYLPKSESWHLYSHNPVSPHNSGVTFSIDATGRIKYTSSNISGTPITSTLSIRARTLSGKNYL
jgi:hypothetical protein